jgi:oxygen-dependent protoporphyrinogen oxidase
MLKDIEYSPMAVVAFGYDSLSHDLDGFGLLTTKSANKDILGVLWDSSIFEKRTLNNQKLIRIMIGGQRNPDLVAKEESEIYKIAKDEVKNIMGITEKPYLSYIKRWYKAIPNYNLGHIANMKIIFEDLKKHNGLYLTGNAYYGVSMNDCIKNARLCAKEISSAVSV